MVGSEPADDTGVHVRIRGKELSLAISEEHAVALKALAQRIGREPFTKRPWAELAFFLVSGGLAGLGLAFVGFTMLAGVVLAITFFGLALLALSLRSARGMGGWQRGLARSMLGEAVEDPEPFAGRRGFLGLAAVLPARPGGLARRGLPRHQGALDHPRRLRGRQPVVGRLRLPHRGVLQPGRRRPAGLGAGPRHLPRRPVLAPGRAASSTRSASSSSARIFFFAAPWVMRGFVNVDRLLIRGLLGPDPMATRVRTLEHARTQTVDASAATLRRIERDLHDGTQAQLVALAMRLGMAKEKLEDADQVDLDPRARARRRGPPAAPRRPSPSCATSPGASTRRPSTSAWRARSTTLAARSAVPTEISFDLRSRPTPAIEAIAYFCVAELLANVAQHAQASRASVSCAQQGTWLRLVVRDDGLGGAELVTGRLLVERPQRPRPTGCTRWTGGSTSSARTAGPPSSPSTSR